MKEEQKKLIQQRLLAPFMPDDIDIRPGSGGKSGNIPLFYLTTRCVDKRLSLLFGLGGYSIKNVSQNIEMERIKKKKFVKQGESLPKVEMYKEVQRDSNDKILSSSTRYETPDSDENFGLLVATICEIHVHTDDMNFVVSNVGEKGLDETGFNKVTSSFAQAYKRAASNMGIGRYLYYLKNIGKVPFTDNKCSIDITADPYFTKIEEALEESGFLSRCEVTGEKIDWLIAAKSMEKFGMVLSPEGFRSLNK